MPDQKRPADGPPADALTLEALPRCPALSGTGARCELEAGHEKRERLHRAGPSEWLTPPPGWRG